jgi:trigger factor
MTKKEDVPGSARSVDELRGMGLLKRSPGVLALEGDTPADLPRVEAPSLEGLSATVPTPAPVTEADVLERFEALCREHAQRRERAHGEALALGDDVLLDVLGFAQGRLLPFSVRTDWWTELAPEPLLPGFFEGLVGMQVGLSAEVALVLPADYPVEPLRGVPARFLVDVKAAREVVLPEAESPELLAALGRGGTLQEVMRRLVEELDAERVEAAQREARNRVLDALAERTQVALPEQLIDEEIRRRWTEAEGTALARKDFSPEELQEALDGWLRDAATRLDAERRLKVALGLRAIAEREHLAPKREELEQWVDVLAETTGTTREEVGRAMASDPSLTQRFQALVAHQVALEHVLARAAFIPEEGG